MAPPPPPRFSTTTGWPRFLLNSSDTMRAMMSVVPPAGNGTISRIGLLGNAWAEAASGSTAQAASSAPPSRRGNRGFMRDLLG